MLDFFENQSKDTQILLVDAGGTKVDAHLLDAKTLSVINHKKFSGANYSTLGKNAFLVALKQVLASFSDKIAHPENTAVIMGVAGVTTSQAQQEITDYLIRQGFDSQNIYVQNDGRLALDLLPQDGAILICGTGSIIFSKVDGQIQEAGGLGAALGDEGSGFALGKAAIKLALEDHLGWGQKTQLTPLIQKHFQNQFLELPVLLKRAEISITEIAQCAPYVFQVAQSGDAVARQILDQAAQELRAQLSSIMTKPLPLYLIGGVFKNPGAEAWIQKITAGITEDVYNISNESCFLWLIRKFPLVT